jgi:hypothetical protein
MAANYRELIVWKEAMDLVERVYALSRVWAADDGSLRELETHMLRANRLGYLEAAAANEVDLRCGQLGRQINGPIRSLQTAPPKPPTADR